VFGLDRFKLHRHLVDGTVKSVWLRQVFVYSGFGLDRFHCITKILLKVALNTINQSIK